MSIKMKSISITLMSPLIKQYNIRMNQSFVYLVVRYQVPVTVKNHSSFDSHTKISNHFNKENENMVSLSNFFFSMRN